MALPNSAASLIPTPGPQAPRPDQTQPDVADAMPAPMPSPATEGSPIPPAPAAFADDTPPPSQTPSIASDYYDEDPSQFDHQPPFRPRRNPARMWTIAASLFAVVALGTAGTVAWYGLPSWVPFPKPTFAAERPGLKLNFPENQQNLRELADHSWFFEVNGTVSNIAQSSQNVPAIIVVLRDARGRAVYTGEITPPKRALTPGETMVISQALVPVPRGAVKAQFGWKPSR